MTTQTFEQAQAESKARYAEWVSRMTEIRDMVSCPRCKAPATTPCVWGTTHSGAQVHTDRIRKAEKVEKINAVAATALVETSPAVVEVSSTPAGQVTTFRSRTSGTQVSVYRAAEAGIDTDGGQWAAVCEDHSSILNTKTAKAAWDAARGSSEWCEGCREAEESAVVWTKVDRGTRTPNWVTPLAHPVEGTTGVAQHPDGIATHVVRWWNIYEQSWVTSLSTENGDQVGAAKYSGTRGDADADVAFLLGQAR